MDTGRAGIAVAMATALLVCSCGRSDQKGQQSASGSTTTNSAAPDAAAPDPGKDLLESGIRGAVNFRAATTIRNGANYFCTYQGYGNDALLSIQADSGQRPFISWLPSRLPERTVGLAFIPNTYSFTQAGMDCYQMPPDFVQRFVAPGLSAGSLSMLIGRLASTDIQFVNEFDEQTVSGPAKARSYHVRFKFYPANPLPGTSGLQGQDNPDGMATCIVVHNNVENTWVFSNCRPTNAAN
jgi:hypothetical protein